MPITTSHRTVIFRTPIAQDLRTCGGDFCAALQNQAFGTPTLTNNFDPALLTGWGVRSSDWTFGASVQQQISARSSIEVAYTRRWYRGFTGDGQPGDGELGLAAVQHHGALGSTAALAEAGYVVSGLYDLNPAMFGQVNNFIEAGRTARLG